MAQIQKGRLMLVLAVYQQQIPKAFRYKWKHMCDQEVDTRWMNDFIYMHCWVRVIYWGDKILTDRWVTSIFD